MKSIAKQIKYVLTQHNDKPYSRCCRLLAVEHKLFIQKTEASFDVLLKAHS